MRYLLLGFILGMVSCAIAQAIATAPRPLVYGHELCDGQRVRFLAERFDMDLGLSLKLPNHGWVWVQVEEPGVIYMLAKDAMIESEPACGNVVRLKLKKD
jgi:hypothetical protein